MINKKLADVRYTSVCRELRRTQLLSGTFLRRERLLKAVESAVTHDKLKCIGHTTLLQRSVLLYLLTPMKPFTHMDDQGRVAMVDTSTKDASVRRAVASGRVLMSRETVAALRAQRTPKGDPIETARIAGIMAAKRTAELIPLCHPLPLTHVDVQASIEEDGVTLTAEVSTKAQTGVEMEALTAVSVAALTVYDMCKALEKGMTITAIRLERKEGGKSGDFQRQGQRQGQGQG